MHMPCIFLLPVCQNVTQDNSRTTSKVEIAEEYKVTEPRDILQYSS